MSYKTGIKAHWQNTKKMKDRDIIISTTRAKQLVEEVFPSTSLGPQPQRTLSSTCHPRHTTPADGPSALMSQSSRDILQKAVSIIMEYYNYEAHMHACTR